MIRFQEKIGHADHKTILSGLLVSEKALLAYEIVTCVKQTC
jgi:hypothetical protein